MMQLKKYEKFLGKDFLEGKFLPSLYNSYYEYYKNVIENWDRILNENIHPDYQAIIARILYMFDDRDKLSKFYQKFNSFEIFSSLSRIFIIQGQYEQIEKILDSLAKREISPRIQYQFDFYLNVVEYFTVVNKFIQASEVLEKAHSLLSQMKEEEKNKKLIYLNEVHYLYTEALLYYMDHKYIKGLRITERAIQIMFNHNIKEPFIQASLLNMQGNCLLYSGSISESKLAYEEAIKIFSDERIERGKIVAKANYAVVLLKQGFFEEGLNELFGLLAFMEQKNELRNIIMISSEIIYSYRLLNDIPSALAILEKAIQISEQYKIGIDYIYPLASEIYAMANQINKAEYYLEKYSKAFGLSKPQLNAYYTIFVTSKGIIEFCKMNYYSAKDFFLKGINYARELNLFPQALNALLYMIELELIMFKIESKEKQEEIIKEIELFSQEIIILLKELNAFYHLVNYMLLLATVYIYSNKLTLAEELIKKVKVICEKHNLNFKEEKVKQTVSLLQKAKKVNTETLENHTMLDFSLEIDNLLKQYTTKGLLNAEIMSMKKEFQFFHFLLIIENIPFFNYTYGEKVSTDDMLVIGMINAIRNLSKTLTIRKGELRILEHSNYILLLLGKERFTIALFVDRFSYVLKKKMEELAVFIEQELLTYTGNNIFEFDELKDLLNDKIKKLFFI